MREWWDAHSCMGYTYTAVMHAISGIRLRGTALIGLGAGGHWLAPVDTTSLVFSLEMDHSCYLMI